MSSDKKYCGKTPSRSGQRPKKRKAPCKYKTTGNKSSRQLVLDEANQPFVDNPPELISDGGPQNPSPGPSQNPELKSRSAQKLCFYDIPYPDSEEDWADIDSDEEEDSPLNPASCRLIDLNIIQAQINQSVSCKNCAAEPYRDIDKSLLRKCLDGLSQNPNESFNNLIWSICPKNKYHGVETVEIAVGLSVIIYNDGMRGLFYLFEKLQLDIGDSAKDVFRKMDQLRVQKAEKRATEASLEARRARRRAKLGLADKQDATAYSSGSY